MTSVTIVGIGEYNVLVTFYCCANLLIFREYKKPELSAESTMLKPKSRGYDTGMG